MTYDRIIKNILVGGADDWVALGEIICQVGPDLTNDEILRATLEQVRASMSTRPAWWLSRLEWSVRALAQPKIVQKTLFPEFVCVADELALDFEECLRGIRETGVPLPDMVLKAIRELDDQIAAMSGPAHAELWTDESLERSEEWEHVRHLALGVAQKMGWPNSSPGRTRQVYVGPSD